MTPEEIREQGKVVGFLLALPGILIFLVIGLCVALYWLERLLRWVTS